MKTKPLAFFGILIFLEGILADVFLHFMQLDAGRGNLLNYQILRPMLEILVAFILLGLGFLLVRLLRNSTWARNINALLDEKLIGGVPRLFAVQGFLLILSVFLIECFFLTYLAIPVPLRPLVAWAVLICFQAWLFLRLMYAGFYRQRPSVGSVLAAKWRGWKPVQRETLLLLATIGLLYFLAFAPLNYLRDKNTHFDLHPDEGVIYPDVVKVLIWQGSFGTTVRNILDGWQWWYGYPYLPMSAAVLVIPRLIFGETFGQNLQLNIFLLRQFVSVLPMTLALILLVYLVTRFENKLFSIGMFVFLLFIPGVVKYNFQFWHPDGIILLLTLLTFFFLERDQLRFGHNFYLAAVTSALSLAIKLFGAFFVLAIAGYLLAGWLQKALSFRKMLLVGLGFLLVMAGAIVISSPTYLVPSIVRTALGTWVSQQNALLHGYAIPDPSGVYQTGLANSLHFFSIYYMKDHVFFLSIASLLVGSFWGARKYLSRIILAWCVAIGFFLINYAAMKSVHYMIPLMLPLYSGLFLLPFIGQPADDSESSLFISRPLAQKLLWGLLIIISVGQFMSNVFIDFTYKVIGINDFFAMLP